MCIFLWAVKMHEIILWVTIVSNQVTPRYSSVSFKIFAQKLFQLFREMSLETPYESNYPHNYEYSDESKPEWFFKHSLWQRFVRYVLHSGITLRSYMENWNTTRSTFLPCFLQTKYQGRNTKQTRFSLYMVSPLSPLISMSNEIICGGFWIFSFV